MTRFAAYVAEAIDALLRNRLRSILTALGVVIGVTAVIAVYGLSAAAASGIERSVNSGDNPGLTIVPDPQQANPLAAQLSGHDAYLVRDATDAIARRVTAFYSANLNFTRRYAVRRGNEHVLAFGFSWYGGDEALEVRAGRTLSAEDQRASANVCLLSYDLAYQFYGSAESAIGKLLDVRGYRFAVVGVTNGDEGTAANEFGGTFYFVLPYTTYENFAPGPIDALLVWPQTLVDEDAARDATLRVLHRAHGQRAAYQVTSYRQSLQSFEKILAIISTSLSAIGAISLFVAGIGIMNIMLVSVTERTREIGIRKSIGASSRDIVLQFLIEASLLSIVGGAIGFILSLAIIAALAGPMAAKLGALTIPYARIALYALTFSIGVGLLFGTYPALRASRLDPVEALRA